MGGHTRQFQRSSSSPPPPFYPSAPTFVSPQFNSYFTVSADIINQATTKHGKSSWHHVSDVGFKALNDAFLLEGAVYQLVREHFRREPYYVDLLELLHETRHPAFFRNPVSVSAFLANNISPQ